MSAIALESLRQKEIYNQHDIDIALFYAKVIKNRYNADAYNILKAEAQHDLIKRDIMIRLQEYWTATPQMNIAKPRLVDFLTQATSRQLVMSMYDQCEHHDWYYMMSDDGNIHARGKTQEADMKRRAEENPHVKRLYEDYRHWYFRMNDDGTRPLPKPVIEDYLP